MSKKGMKLTRKTRTIIIVAIIIVFAMIWGIMIRNINSKKNQNSIDGSSYTTTKEIVESLGFKYISESASTDQNYVTDFKIDFLILPFNQNNTSNEVLYKRLVTLLSQKLKFKNFRLIDTKNEITIEVQGDSVKELIIEYKINGDRNYFLNQSSMIKLKEYESFQITQMNIQSNILNNLISNSFKDTNINYGNKTDTYNNYDEYLDNGIKSRKVNGKVFNIIFTKNYKDNVIDNIKVGMNNQDIINILGEPTFKENNDSSNSTVIGYKGKDIYVFFSNAEISVYRVEKNRESSKFTTLLEKYLGDKDYNSFVWGLTEEWKDYDVFQYTNNMAELKYTLKGVSVVFNANVNSGIKIFNNYSGVLINGKTIKEYANAGNIADGLMINTEYDLVYQEEIDRVNNDRLMRNPEGASLPKNCTQKFIYEYAYIKKNELSDIKVLSRDRTYDDSKIKDKYVTSVEWIHDEVLVYGVKEKGIYLYNAISKTYSTIEEGNSAFIITKVEDNKIYYDDKSVSY